MKRINLILSIILITSISMNAQQMFKKYTGQDIGNPKLKGSFQFDEKLQKFTVAGAGYNLWFESAMSFILFRRKWKAILLFPPV
jgi:TolB protein